MCFVLFSEQTAIIFMYSFNLLVFTTEIEYVYCAVRTEIVGVIRVNHVFLRVECRFWATIAPFH